MHIYPSVLLSVCYACRSTVVIYLYKLSVLKFFYFMSPHTPNGFQVAEVFKVNYLIRTTVCDAQVTITVGV